MKLKDFYLVIMLAATSPVVADELSSGAIAARIAQAESLHAKAQAANHGWVMTSKLISDARAALELDQLLKADALSQRALKTSTASVAQALQEEQAWQSRVPQRGNQ